MVKKEDNKETRKRESRAICIEIGKQIRQIRIKNGLTVAEVAYHAGVEPQNFRKYELGKQEMRISMLYRIAKALKVNVEDLIVD